MKPTFQPRTIEEMRKDETVMNPARDCALEAVGTISIPALFPYSANIAELLMHSYMSGAQSREDEIAGLKNGLTSADASIGLMVIALEKYPEAMSHFEKLQAEHKMLESQQK